MAGTAIEPRIRAPPPQSLHLHRHGAGLLVPRGLWLGGGGDHDLADLLTAAPPHPRGEAADRGHGEALNAAHSRHGLGDFVIQSHRPHWTLEV